MILDVFKLSKKQLCTIVFKERPIVLKDEPDSYLLYHPDFSGLEGEDEELYCKALLAACFQVESNRLDVFIGQQLFFVVEPYMWLDDFSELLDKNKTLFEKKPETLIRYWEMKYFLADAMLEWRPLSIKYSSATKDQAFRKVEEEVGNYEDAFDALDYLAKVKMRASVYIEDAEERKAMDRKLLALMYHIKELEEIEKERLEDQGIELPLPQLVWDDEIRDLVSAFYRIMQKKNKHGKKSLQNKPGEVREFIHRCFIRPCGKRIARSTIKTILTPSRSDKRSNGIELPESFDDLTKED